MTVSFIFSQCSVTWWWKKWLKRTSTSHIPEQPLINEWPFLQWQCDQGWGRTLIHCFYVMVTNGQIGSGQQEGAMCANAIIITLLPYITLYYLIFLHLLVWIWKKQLMLMTKLLKLTIGAVHWNSWQNHLKKNWGWTNCQTKNSSPVHIGRWEEQTPGPLCKTDSVSY